MRKLIKQSYSADNIRERMKTSFLLLGLLAIFLSVVVGGYWGYQEVQLRMMVRNEILSNTAKIVGERFCIFRYESGYKTISEVDKNLGDGCSCIMKFEEKYIYIPYNKTEIKAEYSFTDIMKLKIYNADKMENLFNSNFRISITKRGINLMGDSVTILADKINSTLNNE